MSDTRGLTHEGAIAIAVQEALAADRAIAPSRIEVAAVGTTVTLRGHVPSPQAKARVERIARGVAGVIDVTNEVEIDAGSLLGEDAAGLLAAAGAGARSGGGGVGVAGLAAAQLVGATGAEVPPATAPSADGGPLNDWEG